MNDKCNTAPQEAPEVMSSSDSPSSYDSMARNYDDWEDVFSSSAPPLIGLTWNHPPELSDSGDGESHTDVLYPEAQYTLYHEKATGTWYMRLLSVTCGVQVTIYTGGFKDASVTPPATEAEAVDAINEMNGYQARGYKGEWHTAEASKIHEYHHKREWVDTCNYFFSHHQTQRQIEKLTVPYDLFPSAIDALIFLKPSADAYIDKFYRASSQYYNSLPDDAGARPYCAGQQELNKTTQAVISSALASRWTVPTHVTVPGTIEPPCFLPPVNGAAPAPRSMAAPSSPSAALFLRDVQDMRNQPLSLVFHNTGYTTLRILDTLDEPGMKIFLDISMTDASGRKTLLCTRCRKVDFAANVPYRDIAPGGEYAVSVPLCRMVPESTWNRLPAGTYTLEAAYHNHYGDDCLKGGLTTSCEVIIS